MISVESSDQDERTFGACFAVSQTVVRLRVIIRRLATAQIEVIHAENRKPFAEIEQERAAEVAGRQCQTKSA